LLLANTPRCQAYSGLAPPSLRPCWAHKQKQEDTNGILLLLIYCCV